MSFMNLSIVLIDSTLVGVILSIRPALNDPLWLICRKTKQKKKNIFQLDIPNHLLMSTRTII